LFGRLEQQGDRDACHEHDDLVAITLQVVDELVRQLRRQDRRLAHCRHAQRLASMSLDEASQLACHPALQQRDDGPRGLYLPHSLMCPVRSAAWLRHAIGAVQPVCHMRCECAPARQMPLAVKHEMRAKSAGSPAVRQKRRAAMRARRSCRFASSPRTAMLR
jgi:hypothetical protein